MPRTFFSAVRAVKALGVKRMETKQKATVVTTYNSVKDYASGVYQGRNGRVVVVSQDNTKSWRNTAQLKQIETAVQLFGTITPEDVKKMYVYVGVEAMVQALDVAQIAADTKAKTGNKFDIELVACDCNAPHKELAAQIIGAKIIWCECGGRETLSEIVRKELGE